MNLRKSSVLALIAFAAVPFASEARTGPTVALDACVKSFVETYLPNHPVRHVRKRMPAPSPIQILARSEKYTVALSAHGVKSGDLIAQARCVVNNNGVVVVLDSPPVEQYASLADFVVSVR